MFSVQNYQFNPVQQIHLIPFYLTLWVDLIMFHVSYVTISYSGDIILQFFCCCHFLASLDDNVKWRQLETRIFCMKITD